MTHQPVKSLVPGLEGCQYRGPVCGLTTPGPHETEDVRGLLERAARMADMYAQILKVNDYPEAAVAATFAAAKEFRAALRGAGASALGVEGEGRE